MVPSNDCGHLSWLLGTETASLFALTVVWKLLFGNKKKWEVTNLRPKQLGCTSLKLFRNEERIKMQSLTFLWHICARLTQVL